LFLDLRNDLRFIFLHWGRFTLLNLSGLFFGLLAFLIFRQSLNFLLDSLDLFWLLLNYILHLLLNWFGDWLTLLHNFWFLLNNDNRCNNLGSGHFFFLLLDWGGSLRLRLLIFVGRLLELLFFVHLYFFLYCFEIVCLVVLSRLLVLDAAHLPSVQVLGLVLLVVIVFVDGGGFWQDERVSIEGTRPNHILAKQVLQRLVRLIPHFSQHHLRRFVQWLLALIIVVLAE